MRPLARLLVAVALVATVAVASPDAPTAPVAASEPTPRLIHLTAAGHDPAPMEGVEAGLRWQHAELAAFLRTAHRHKPRTARAPAVRVRAPMVVSVGTVNGYPCGGQLPPCRVLARESGGNPTARNPVSSASGLWQFLDSTWANFGGYPRAYLAPPSVQNEKARLTWAGGAGCRHWSACG